MTKDERDALYDQINALKEQLEDDEEERFIAEARSAEEQYLGRYFKDVNGVLYHPVCVLTPECPYQIWTLVINTDAAFKQKPNIHKMRFGPEDGKTYWLYYEPMYCIRKFHASFSQLTEITQEEFDIAAKEQFEKMWEQIHDSLTLDNFKEKVTHRYDIRL